MYNVTSLDLSLTLEDLAPNTVYSVEVYAVTIERGQSSNHVYFITTQGSKLMDNVMHVSNSFT